MRSTNNKRGLLLAICCALLLGMGLGALGEEPRRPDPEAVWDAWTQTPSEVLQEEVQTPSIVADKDDARPDEEDPEEDVPQVDTDAFTLTVKGQQRWNVRLGVGDPMALSPMGLAPGLPVLEQSPRADIPGTVMDFLTLEARFDDQLGPGFQHLSITLDRDPWSGELGDFFAGVPELGVYNKKLLGARIGYTGDGFTATAVAARLQGISDSRTFRGTAASGERLFTYLDPEDPWSPAPYTRSVLGLYHHRLRLPYVEGFSEVLLTLKDGTELSAFLTEYGLDYIVELFEAAPSKALPSGEFMILEDDGDILLLRSPPDALLRRRVRDAINDYNTREGLVDEDRKRYPFVSGSELEQEFLTGLQAFALIEVDGEDYRFQDAGRRRYLSLGERDILEGTLDLYVRRPGQEAFLPIDHPELAAYAWTLFPERGVVKIDFPSAFFDENAALRATFDHKREGNVFMLGLSIVPRSERVYRNNELLTREVHYSIDYEVGVLILFSALGEDDELRVEFERQRGALGVPTDYERAIFAVTFALPDTDNLELVVARAADLGSPQPDTPTMPNTHTVAGLRLSGDIAGWDYRLTMGGSQNVFPPGENARLAGPNRINVIREATVLGDDVAVFGHQDGLTVHDGVEFRHYGPAEGLGGRQVRDLLALPDALLVATEAGLTVVRLVDPSPFDRVGSWVRLLSQHGFPGKEATALAMGGGNVYLTTDEALAWFAPGEEEEPDLWSVESLPDGAGTGPHTLLWAHGKLYLGSTNGLHAWDGEMWRRVGGVTGEVRALARIDDVLYVATGRGIRALRDEQGAGWIAPGTDVRALSAFRGVLWYAGPEGLFREGDLTPTVAQPVTALGRADFALWAGGRADAAYNLDLWRVDDRIEHFPPRVTQIDGRDRGSFEDIPVIDHTAVGLTAHLTAQREIGDWDVDLEVSSRGSGYQEIGSARGAETHRAVLSLTHDAGPWLWKVDARTDWREVQPGVEGLTDAHRFGVSLTYQEEGEWSGGARLHWELGDMLTVPDGTLSAGFDVTWKPGPTYALSLTPKLEGDGLIGLERVTSGYRLSASFPGDTWTGSLSLSGHLRYPDWRAVGRIDASTTVKPWSGWMFELKGHRPYRTDGRGPGDQGADLTIRWRDSTDAVSWTVTWTETLRHRIGTDTVRWERSAATEFRWATVALNAAEVTPTLRLSYDDTVREDRWQAQLSGRIRTDDTNLQLSGTLTQGYRPAVERRERTLATNVRWEYTGWAGLTPSVNWQSSWQFLTPPVYGDRLTDRHELTGRLTWEPEEVPWKNELSLTYRSRDDSLALTNTLSVPTDWGTIRITANAMLRDEVLRGDVSASSAWTFGEMWNLGAQLGYTFIHRPEDATRHALIAGVFLTATF